MELNNNQIMSGSITYSFIIPHKNCPELLQRCVDSIPVRDDIQIIVIDDNSDDEKKPKIMRDGLEIILLDANQSKGAGRARNEGLKKAVGKWLLFPDSDDYYKVGFLDVLDEYISKNVDVIYFNCEYRDGDTNELLPPIYFNKDFEEYDGSLEAIDKIKYHHNAPWTKMISKEYVLHHKFVFEEVPNGNDILFSMSVGYCTERIEVIRQPLYIYLCNKNGLTQKKLSENEAFCLLLHTIQMNHFYKNIGHPEWCLPLFKKTLFYIKLCGLSIFFRLRNRMKIVYNHRNDWPSKMIPA